MAITAQALLRTSEEKALETFHRAAQRVPAYREILQRAGVNPAEVRTMEQFRERVPLIDKQSTFARFEIDQLCLDGRLGEVSSVIASSGHSGVFSFGLLTPRDIERTLQAHDQFLSRILKADQRKTLIINCLPMGVHMYSRLAVIADTSVREETAVALVKKLARQFDQILLVGDAAFIKKVIEEGQAAGVDWASLHVHVGAGGETVPENWRSYIASLLHIDLERPEAGLIGGSMGVAELFQNVIFQETLETIALRRLAHRDRQVREALFGPGVEACPMLFVYHPEQTYVEQISSDSPPGEIAITMLDPQLRIPLPRYRTDDRGQGLDPKHVAETLQALGHPPLGLEQLPLPMMALYGRRDHLLIDGYRLFPEAVKEALYKDFEVARSLTAGFKLRRNGSEGELLVQLERQKLPEKWLENALQASLACYVRVPLRLRLYRYEDFPYGMRLDYERKFSYLEE